MSSPRTSDPRAAESRSSASAGPRAGGGVRMPLPRLAAGVLLGIETAVLFGLGVLQVVRGFGSDIDDMGRAETGGALALLGAAGLGLVTWGVLRGRSGFRSPGLVAQIFCLPVAWSLLQGGLYGYGVPLVVVPVTVMVLLMVALPGEADDAEAAADSAATGDAAPGDAGTGDRAGAQEAAGDAAGRTPATAKQAKAAKRAKTAKRSSAAKQAAAKPGSTARPAARPEKTGDRRRG